MERDRATGRKTDIERDNKMGETKKQRERERDRHGERKWDERERQAWRQT